MADRFPNLSSRAGGAPEADWDALVRFLADESDPVEAARVRAWLAAHPEDAALVDAVKAHTVRAASRADVDVDTERALGAVRARLSPAGAGGSPPVFTVERGVTRGPSAAGSFRRSWRVTGFAAAAGLAALATLAQFRGSRPAVAVTERAYATAVGQRDSLRLPDGSTVVLAPGSRLTLAADFGTDTREVTLEGAAYFDVRHDATRPFTVHTATADVRDIGTAFSVKTAGADEVLVDVTHGIVALSGRRAARAPVELRAGDRGVLAREALTVSRGSVTDADVAWTRGRLSYRDASLAEVRADLRRWYGVELQVSDRVLATRTITASFGEDTVAHVVRVIALALGADAVQRGDTVTLLPQGNGATTSR
jgi:transmembrane sensor